jgi:Zn-dependent protease
MGFQDRRYDPDDTGEGFFRRMSRGVSFNPGDFFGWSLPLFTVPQRVPWLGGIHVRVHVIYILVAVSELLHALSRESMGIGYGAAMMGTLFVLVLLHEFGHCIACRAVGGEADQVLMWPLGGLAYCRPPHRWQPALITTLGGPGVNVLLTPVLGAALLAAGAQWANLSFNPLSHQSVYEHAFYAPETWKHWLWAAYYMNLILLAFNMLVPMFPMDCGRVVQELLWWRLGYKRSMQIAVKVGFAGAIVLGMIGFATSEMRLMALALFGGSVCYSEFRRLAMMEDESPWGFDTDKGYQGFKSEPVKRVRKADKAVTRRQEQEQKEQVEVDRILDKVRAQGLASLSSRERAALQAATDRTRAKG